MTARWVVFGPSAMAFSSILGGIMEDDSARRIGLDHALDDHAVEVPVPIERRPEPVEEGHWAAAPWRWASHCKR